MSRKNIIFVVVSASCLLLANFLFLALNPTAFAQSVEKIEGDVDQLLKDFNKLLEEKSPQVIGGDVKTNTNIASKCTIDGKEVPCAEAASFIKKILLFIRGIIDSFINLLDQLF
ncbi:MAG: hypothetical protein AAB897_03310 [Patescibacteria group bacterium]